MLRRLMIASSSAPPPSGVIWNASDSHVQAAISNAGRTVTYSAGVASTPIARSNAAAITGKRYWEVRVDLLSGAYTYAMNIGVQNLASASRDAPIGSAASSGAALIRDGRSYYAGALAAYSSAFVQGDVVGIAIDRSANRMWFSINGVWGDGTADPASGTGFASFTLNSVISYIPAVNVASGSSLTANFAASDFVYTAPSGFIPLTT